MERNHGDPSEETQIKFRETQRKQEATYAGKYELARTHSIHRAVP